MDETPASAEPVETPPPPPRRGWSRKTRFILISVLLTPFILFGLYTLLVLNWSYSDGFRSGILQKFSRKGYICKTWEGELAMTTVPGVAPTTWVFSVRDDEVARKVSAAIGKRVSVHYTEHRGIPSDCFASTNYFVDSVSAQ
jgi:hypothetical protein